MKLKILFAFFLLISASKCDVLEETFFLHILENVVVPNLPSLHYVSKIRFAVTITHSAYEALVPYLSDGSSKGILAAIPRVPVVKRTVRNKNIAIGYAAYRVIDNLLPEKAKFKLDEIFKSVNLDPANHTLDLSSPIGIGNHVAKLVLELRADDGMNQYGDLSGRSFNLIPYEDYTNYKPKNTAYDLFEPTKWQPIVEESSTLKGVYVVQTYAFPQYAQVKLISSINADKYTVTEPPKITLIQNYKRQVDEILNESKKLNSYKKMSVEHFSDKITGLLDPVLFLAKKYKLSQDEIITLDFLTHIALHDAGAVLWREKLKYDSIRPISAVRYFYHDTEFEAWGGVGAGIVKNMTGRDWLPYAKVNNHAEYPSAVSCFCAAQFAVLEKYFNTTEFGYSTVKPVGSSLVEPNITPMKEITLGPYRTFGAYVDECAISRVWGGVHFKQSVEQAKQLCRQIGLDVYNFAVDYIPARN